ncbi:hypothetical protein [Actinophytocola oryzae]|uniref:hypothetical protein n=1 Tax=Actinophytocola oryzae TaxID=502181 RepID=UPI001414D39F
MLARSGEPVSDELVRPLRRDLGLAACQPRTWRPITTDPDTTHRIPDLLGRTSPPARPARNWSRHHLPRHRHRLILEIGCRLIHGRPLQDITHHRCSRLRSRHHHHSTGMRLPF